MSFEYSSAIDSPALVTFGTPHRYPRVVSGDDKARAVRIVAAFGVVLSVGASTLDLDVFRVYVHPSDAADGEQAYDLDTELTVASDTIASIELFHSTGAEDAEIDEAAGHSAATPTEGGQ